MYLPIALVVSQLLSAAAEAPVTRAPRRSGLAVVEIQLVDCPAAAVIDDGTTIELAVVEKGCSSFGMGSGHVQVCYTGGPPEAPELKVDIQERDFHVEASGIVTSEPSVLARMLGAGATGEIRARLLSGPGSAKRSGERPVKSDLLSSARFVPAFADGKFVGVKVFAIKPGSVLDKAGFRNGDTVRQVGDTPATAEGDFMRALAGLTDSSESIFQVARRDETLTIRVPGR